MSYLKLFLLTLALTPLTLSQVRASGGGEAPKAEGGEAKEGEAKAETKKDAYGEAVGQVAALQAKIHASEETIHKLIEEKQHSKNQEEIGNIVRELVKEHQALKKTAEAYDQARSNLQYRFPEKGLKEKRVYERVEVKSLEEMENSQSMESRIKKTLGKVRKQYDPPDDRKSSKSEKDAHAADPSRSSRGKKKSGSSDISDPVILTK